MIHLHVCRAVCCRVRDQGHCTMEAVRSVVNDVADNFLLLSRTFVFPLNMSLLQWIHFQGGQEPVVSSRLSDQFRVDIRDACQSVFKATHAVYGKSKGVYKPVFAFCLFVASAPESEYCLLLFLFCCYTGVFVQSRQRFRHPMVPGNHSKTVVWKRSVDFSGRLQLLLSE